jgi:hypothetical protein
LNGITIMLAPLILGIAGSLITAITVCVLAARRGFRAWSAAGLVTMFLFGLLYTGVLQVLVMAVDTAPLSAVLIQPEDLYLAYAGTSAILAFAITVALSIVTLSIVRRSGKSFGRRETLLRGAVITAVIAAVAGPILIHNQLSIDRALVANEAEITALRMTYKDGLERLMRLGAVTKIQVGDSAITHFIAKPLYGLGEKRLAEYAKASMIYNVYVAGNHPKPIILRTSDTARRIGVFGMDGVYTVDPNRHAPHNANLRR